MITFKTRIEKFGENGWSCIVISPKIANQLKPDTKVSFRVKGKLENHAIQKTSLLPMGDGKFMLPFNASMRKATGKKAGNSIIVSLEIDESKIALSKDLLNCLKEDPEGLTFFKALPASHQRYFSKWIEDAKTTPTKTKRLVICLIAFNKKMNFPETMQAYKAFEV